MNTRIHIKLARTIAVVAVLAAVAVPIAVAGLPGGDHVEPPSILHYRGAGSAGSLPRSQFTIHYTEPGSTGYLPRPRFSLAYTEPGS
jgi:hypothetical protein